MRRAAVYAALLWAAALAAHAGTARFLRPDGTLFLECELTGDATVFPDGRVIIACGPNLLPQLGVARFASSPVRFDNAAEVALPLERAAGAAGVLTATLTVTGPCTVRNPDAVFIDGATVPRAPAPTVRALPGVRAAVCSINISGPSVGSPDTLTAIVTDSTCTP